MTTSQLPESVVSALERTARTVRKEETALTLWQAAVGMCAFFGLVVLVEHWVLPGGIPRSLRVVLDFLFLGACAFTFCRRILPFLRWKLNPFYLATVIEKARPDLKNGLLNLLFLKKAPPTPAGHFATEAVAARLVGLADVPYFPAGRLRRWKWAATGAFLFLVLYAIFSPKSTLWSVARVLFPWANISVPTRVQIDAVQPGDCTLYQGETLAISARFRRLREGETPVLFYSSDDKKYVNAPVSLAPDPEKKGVWAASVSDVQQNLTWRLEAGDARTETFRLAVLPPLRVTIESLRLAPPAYTRLPVVTQTAGDLQAVAGTRIDLRVRTSEPAREVVLKLDGKTAVKFRPVVEKGRASETRFIASLGSVKASPSRGGGDAVAGGVSSKRSESLPLPTNPPVSLREPAPLEGGPLNGEPLREPAPPLNASPSRGGGDAVAGGVSSKRSESLPLPTNPPVSLREPAPLGGGPLNGEPLREPAPLGGGPLNVGVYEASFHFQNRAGRSNKPLKYRWEILPDGGPEVRILEGPENDSVLGESEETTVKISASDPDFGLRAVAFRAEWNGKPLAIPPLLNLPRDRAGLRTPFEAEFVFLPSEWGLKAGDEILWWAEAADSREPDGNRAGTKKRRLKIVGEAEENAETADGSDGSEDSETDPKEGAEEDSPFPVSAEMPGQEDAKAQGKTLEGEEAGEQNSGENGEQSGEQSDSGDGEKGSGGDQSDSGDGEKESSEEAQKNGSGDGSGQNSGQSSGEGSDENSDGSKEGASEGAEGSENGGAESGSSPKTAADGYDPLSENEAQEAGEKPDDQAGEESGEQSGEESGDQPGGNSGQQSGEKSGEKSQQKSGGKRQEKGQNSGLEQETDAEEGEELEKRGENGKKTGPDSQSGAKTESKAPEDATSAQSGLQNGSDSRQDLPAPVKEKEKSDGSGLRDSNSKRPGRDKMEDDSDETGEPNPENTRLAEKDELEEGSKPDPVSNPGEAMEEILKHRQNELEKAGKLPPNPDSPGGKDGDSQAPPPQTDAQAEMGKDPKELKKNESNPEASQGGSEKKDEKKSGQSSPQNGNQQGNAGDRKSKNEIKPDNSAEAGGNAGENKGGNRQGAEEQSNQQGLGRDGSNTPNESGNPAGSGGEGPQGERGGNSALADHPTGSADPNQREGNGSDSQKGERESQAYGSGQSTEQSEHATASGGSGIGSEMRAPMGEESSATPSAKEDAVNVEFARQQTVLALDHLRDALDRDDDSLLEYLGWTREEARQFLKEWEKLNQDLTKPGLSEEEFRERQDAFRSLGITPRSIQYKNRTQKETVRPSVRGGRKVEAPEAWREQFEAYSRGVGEGDSVGGRPGHPVQGRHTNWVK